MTQSQWSVVGTGRRASSGILESVATSMNETIALTSLIHVISG